MKSTGEQLANSGQEVGFNYLGLLIGPCAILARYPFEYSCPESGAPPSSNIAKGLPDPCLMMCAHPCLSAREIAGGGYLGHLPIFTARKGRNLVGDPTRRT